MLSIRRYVSPLLQSNMYVIAEGGHAVVIDPSEDTGPSVGLTIDYIILTHEHYDHISGVNKWKIATGAPVLCSAACAENITDPKRNMARHFGDFCELQTWIRLESIPSFDPVYTCVADMTFEEKLSVIWEGHELSLFTIPGHSQGSIGIILDGKHFFSGDSMLKDHSIELRFPGGSRKKWEQIGAPRLAGLPDMIEVHPGHFEEYVYEKGVEN